MFYCLPQLGATVSVGLLVWFVVIYTVKFGVLIVFFPGVSNNKK